MNLISLLFRISAIAFLAVNLTGCGKWLDKKETRSVSWTPDRVSIRCADEANCPSHQGLLMGYWREGDVTRIERCTASLYSATRIITAGHCSMGKADSIFFLPVPKPGLPSVRLPAKRLFLYNERDQDYGAYELLTPAEGRDFVYPGPAVSPGDKPMVALVVNQRVEDNFVIDALRCVHTAGKLTRFDLSENPFKFYLKDCRAVTGNSGGAVFMEGDLSAVLGILATGSKDAVSVDDMIRRQNDYGTIDFAGITNARCFELPGWPKLEPTCKHQ